jgi:hypothetical protein
VRTFSNAASTLDVLDADVSMYIIPFSAKQDKVASAHSQWRRFAKELEQGWKRTGKGFGHFGRDDTEPVKIRLVSDEHGDDVRVRVLAQLFDPCLDVAEG